MTDYYVETGHGGTDSGTLSNPWLTIDQAMNEMATAGAGPHQVWIKASGTYTELANIDTVGTASAPITFEGYTSSTGDGGQITIDGSSSNAYGIGNSAGAVALYYIFKNIIVSNVTGICFDMNATGDSATFINCIADNGGSVGFYGDNNIAYYQCISRNNSTNGFQVDGDAHFICCEAHDNTNHQMRSQDGVFLSCIIYGIPATYAGIYIDGASGQALIMNCTIDGENVANTSGIEVLDNGFERITAINNIIYDCNIGIEVPTSAKDYNLVGYNLINSNNTDYSNIVNTIGNDVTTAPDFVNEASHDYTLNSSSPAVDVGTDGADV